MRSMSSHPLRASVSGRGRRDLRPWIAVGLVATVLGTLAATGGTLAAPSSGAVAPLFLSGAPSAPTNVSAAGVTATGASLSWNQSATGVTNDTVEVFGGSVCVGLDEAISTGSAVTSYSLVGLEADRNYSVEIVAWNLNAASAASACAPFTTPPAAIPGFTLGGAAVEWQNYSLPGWPGAAYFDNLTGHRRTDDTPVLSQYGPNGVLTAYYVDQGDQLVAYDLQTGTVTVLVDGWPYNLSDPSAVSMLYGFQSAQGQLTVLYAEGALQAPGPTHFEWVAWYDLANGTYLFENTTIEVPCPCNVADEPYNNGIGVYNGSAGWLFWGDDDYHALAMFNVYSRALVTAVGPVMPGWNSIVAVPSADQLVADANDPGNRTVELLAVNLTTSGGVDAIQYALRWSPVLANVTGPDSNNMPYFIDPGSGTTILWGIGSDGGSTYHLIVANLSSDLALDRVTNLSELGRVGTTDLIAAALWDTSGSWLDGTDGELPSAASQALFLDPLDRSALYAVGEPWIDALVSDTLLGFTASGWASPQVGFFGMTGNENVLFPGTFGTHLILYWLSSVADPWGGLSPPVNVTATAVSTSAVSVAWQNPALPGLENDTVWYGRSCSALTASVSTDGATDAFTLTGLARDTTYCIEVQVNNATAFSVRSGPAVATSEQIPPAPKGVTVTPLSPSTAEVNWTAAAPRAGVVNDTVELFAGRGCRSVPAGLGTDGPAAGWVVTGLSAERNYSIEVVAWGNGGAGPASACHSFSTRSTVPPDCAVADCALTLSIASGSPGNRERVSATGFKPRATYTVDLAPAANGSVGTSIATGSTGRWGVFNVSFAIPGDAPGAYTVRVSDPAGDDLSATLALTALSASGSEGDPGSQVMLSGAGFPAATKVTFKIGGVTAAVPRKCETSATGAFSGCAVTVPAINPGQDTLVASGGPARGRLPFEVIPPPVPRADPAAIAARGPAGSSARPAAHMYLGAIVSVWSSSATMGASSMLRWRRSGRS